MTLETLLQYNSFGMTPLIFSFLTFYEMSVVSQTNSDAYHLFYKEIIPQIRRFDCLNSIKRNHIPILSEFIGLRHLEIESIPFYHIDQLVNALSNITQLEIFKYSHNFIDHYSALQLKSLLDLWPNTLQTLELSHNCLSKRIVVLTPIFPKLRRLQYLNVSSNGIHKNDGIQLAKSLYGLSELKEINIENNQLGRGGIVFAQLIGILPQLEVMKLSSNQLGPDGLRAFAKIISSLTIETLTPFHTLELSWNKIDTESLSHLVQSCQKFSKLRCLDLSWNCLDGDNISICQSSFSYLKHLTTMNLSWNFIGMEGAFSLSKILPSLTQLQVLNLSTCKIKNEGFCSLSHCFPCLKHLRQMDLSWNEIVFRKKEMKVLIDSIIELTQLEMIDLSKNRFQRDMIPLLKTILSRSSSFHTLNLFDIHTELS